jgi:hypothetical protein
MVRLLSAVCVLALIALSTSAGADDSEADKADRVAAVFLYKMIKYVDWPNLEGAQAFHICLLGDRGVEPHLRAIANKRRAKNLPISLVGLENLSAASGCQVLYIGRAEVRSVQQVVRWSRIRPVLTVSRCPGCGREGIGINFVESQGRLRFEINRGAITQDGLTIRSQLLQLGVIVDESR